MFDAIKETLNLESGDVKKEKLRSRLREEAENKFQVAEWDGHLYIVYDGVPVKNSFKTLEEVVAELQKMRDTWISFLESHPNTAARFLRN